MNLKFLLFQKTVLWGVATMCIQFQGFSQNQKQGKFPKLSRDLIQLSHSSASFRKSATIADSTPAKIHLYNDLAGVTITADSNALILSEQLIKLGLTEIQIYEKVISGMLPVSAIPALNELEGIRFARPTYKPRKQVGFTTTQGDSAQRSSIARQLYRVSGKNIKIGVISDSYNWEKKEQQGVPSGDLPGAGNPSGHLTPVKVIRDFHFGGYDEGRAMCEIIHDIAPDAELYFYSGFYSEVDFANGILQLAEAGCNIIVDDIGYMLEPYFQDGIIAQAVDKVTEKGVVYFSSAGNAGSASYESAYHSTGKEPYPGLGTAYDFGNGDYLQQVTIPAYGGIFQVLQWDDSFYSAGGEGARTDLDIYILNAKNDSIVWYSRDLNIGNDPVEVINFYNQSEDTQFNIMITKTAGPDPKAIKYLHDNAMLNEYNTQSATIVGHANARGAIAVGAVAYHQSPAYGAATPVLEYFSSKGGTKIYVDKSGQPISPLDRQKPEICAPDGVNTSFFPSFIPVEYTDSDGDGFPNFFGTSAAAPHAAAVAALIAEATSRVNREEILWALQSTAADMDDTVTNGFDFGFDYLTGYGLIQADLAIEAAIRGKTYVSYLILLPQCSHNPEDTRAWKIINANDFPVSTTLSVYNGIVKNLIANPGISYVHSMAVGGINYAFLNWMDEKLNLSSIPSISLGEQCNIMSLKKVDGHEGSDETMTISTYPNPVTDQLVVNLNTAETGDVKMFLKNAQSISLISSVMENGETTQVLDTSLLPAGIYFLTVDMHLKSTTVKIIKQ